MNKIELERLINKPRAFRNHIIAPDIPVRQTMVFLGSESINHELPKSYRQARKIIRSKSFII